MKKAIKNNLTSITLFNKITISGPGGELRLRRSFQEYVNKKFGVPFEHSIALFIAGNQKKLRQRRYSRQHIPETWWGLAKAAEIRIEWGNIPEFLH